MCTHATSSLLNTHLQYHSRDDSWSTMAEKGTGKGALAQGDASAKPDRYYCNMSISNGSLGNYDFFEGKEPMIGFELSSQTERGEYKAQTLNGLSIILRDQHSKLDFQDSFQKESELVVEKHPKTGGKVTVAASICGNNVRVSYIVEQHLTIQFLQKYFKLIVSEDKPNIGVIQTTSLHCLNNRRRNEYYVSTEDVCSASISKDDCSSV